MRKALRRVRQDPDVENVHNLRTGLRRFEALSQQALPKRVRRLRKQAGRVRDYDVLLKLVDDLGLTGEYAESAERLKEDLSKRRQRETRELLLLAQRVRPAKLKRWSKKRVQQLDSNLDGVVSEFKNMATDPDYENLGQHNLHDFRLQVKPLRYRAEMLDDPQAESLAKHFNDIQDVIGGWHDVMLLSDLAEQVLGGRDGNAMQRIRQEMDNRYTASLEQALRVRREILPPKKTLQVMPQKQSA